MARSSLTLAIAVLGLGLGSPQPVWIVQSCFCPHPHPPHMSGSGPVCSLPLPPPNFSIRGDLPPLPPPHEDRGQVAPLSPAPPPNTTPMPKLGGCHHHCLPPLCIQIRAGLLFTPHNPLCIQIEAAAVPSLTPILMCVGGRLHPSPPRNWIRSLPCWPHVLDQAYQLDLPIDEPDTTHPGHTTKNLGTTALHHCRVCCFQTVGGDNNDNILKLFQEICKRQYCLI